MISLKSSALTISGGCYTASSTEWSRHHHARLHPLHEVVQSAVRGCGVGHVAAIEPAGRSLTVAIDVPPALARYIATKGSVAVDGMSLTVNSVRGNRFTVNIIPHTQDRTMIGSYKAGTAVNIEVDLLARYLERLLQAGGETKIDRGFLEKHGVSADYYHAGLDMKLREARQDAWMKGETRIIVATNAFGMGIDKSNVRLVLHYDLPDSLEAYYQDEINRAEHRIKQMKLHMPAAHIPSRDYSIRSIQNDEDFIRKILDRMPFAVEFIKVTVRSTVDAVYC